MATPSLRLDVFSLFQEILCLREQGRPSAKEYGRMKICSALLIICVSTVHCGGQVPANGKMTAGKLEVLPRATEITLDLTPMTDPLSVFVLLGADNQAKVVHYARNQLNVVAIYQGNLPGEHVSQLLAKTGEPAFVEALRRKNFGGAGLSRGDQFHLSIKSEKNVVGECFGFIEDAPAVVRDLIKNLLALKKQLRDAAVADAYLRSEPIASERFEALQSRGKLRFLTIQEFPLSIQSILNSAVTQPRDFLPISRTQYEQLLPQASHGHEFFMTVNGSGYQLSLLQARDKTVPPTKGDN